MQTHNTHTRKQNDDAVTKLVKQTCWGLGIILWYALVIVPLMWLPVVAGILTFTNWVS